MDAWIALPRTSGTFGSPMADDKHTSASIDPQLEELYAQVYANPEDDAARLVLADALIERRDPRGDFIALQFGRKSGRAMQEQKELKLLRGHEDAWLGPLRSCTTHHVFERGFLARCHARAVKLTLDMVLAREWSTVHTIDARIANMPAMLQSEHIRNWTRCIDNIDGRQAAYLLESKHVRRWCSLTVRGGSSEAISRALAQCTTENMPRLSSFELNGVLDRGSALRFVEAPIARQLDSLTLIDEANAALEALTIVRELFGTGQGPRRLVLGGEAGRMKIDLRGELAGSVELGLIRSPQVLTGALAMLAGAPIKVVRILKMSAERPDRARDFDTLCAAAARLGSVKVESIP